MGKKSTKLPKRIAGVKIPKKLRKRGGKMVDMLAHPLVADVAAAALLAAAQAIKESKRVRSATATAREKAGELANEAGDGAASLGTVIAAKANEGARRLGAAYEAMSEGAGNGNGSSGGKDKKGKK